MLPADTGASIRLAAEPPAPLRDVEQAAYEAAPTPDARPVSVRQLARLAGYRDTGHFREAVNQLLERDLLVRVRGGIRRSANGRH
jgi:hypothetical protein